MVLFTFICSVTFVTDKLLGIILIGLSIFSLIILPFICNGFIIRGGIFKPWYAFIVWVFFVNSFLLGWIGSLPIIDPYFTLGCILVIMHFFIVFVLFPLCGFLDKLIYHVYILRGFVSKSKLNNKKIIY